jgi:hypothetical protein
MSGKTVCGVDELHPLLRSAHRDDEAGRLFEGLKEPLPLAGRAAIGLYALGRLDDDRDHARRLTVLVEDRGIVQVHPDLLRTAVPVKSQLLVPVGEGFARKHHLHDIVVEVRDLAPALANLGAEEIRVTPAGKDGIGVVVQHDAVLAPKHDDRHGR